MRSEARIAALEERVAVLEACLVEIERKLKLRRRPGAKPPLPLPPPTVAKPVRSGTPNGPVQRPATEPG